MWLRHTSAKISLLLPFSPAHLWYVLLHDHRDTAASLTGLGKMSGIRSTPQYPSKLFTFEKTREKQTEVAAGGEKEGGRHNMEELNALGVIAFQGLIRIMLHEAQKTRETFTAYQDIKFTGM